MKESYLIQLFVMYDLLYLINHWGWAGKSPKKQLNFGKDNWQPCVRNTGARKERLMTGTPAGEEKGLFSMKAADMTRRIAFTYI